MSLTFFNEWSCQLWERWDVCKSGAYEWAKKAIELDEQNYVAAYVLGRVLIYDGQYELAEHYLRQSIKINANDTESLIQIAICFIYLGYPKEALKLYERILRLSPLMENSYCQLGALVYFENDDMHKCLELGSRVIKSHWVDFPTLLAAAYFHIGDEQRMWVYWLQYLQDFRARISKDDNAHGLAAVQWLKDVNPYRVSHKMKVFWDYVEQRHTDEDAIFPTVPEITAQPQRLNEQQVFRKEGDSWFILFDRRSVRMTDAKGFKDISRLLALPRNSLHCTDLMGGQTLVSKEPAFDEQSKRAYHKKLQELKQEIQEAEDFNNVERAMVLQKEYDQLLEHLTSAIGLKSKVRTLKDPVEKARSAVTWRIRKAIQKIGLQHPSLANHLNVSIRTGTFCSYEPEKELMWECDM